PAGTYIVRVAHYENCNGNRAVGYRISVNNCGETAVFTGSFAGVGDRTTCDRDPGSQQQWCQSVVSFELEPCESGLPRP
ncbi:MAG: hypothetical protein OEY14_09495, partial [Myxococcales bacterium]|nr:hypothetical protein [Myxococcales bacterium]